MINFNKIFKTVEYRVSNLVEAIEDLGWYRSVFNFIIRNYKSIILKSDNSEYEIKITDVEGFVRLVKTNQHTNEKNVKSFDSLREAFTYLMTWYDTNKQIRISKEYEVLNNFENTIVVEEEDGYND